MNITYIENRTYTLEELLELYSNVGWTSYTEKPDKLAKAIKNSLFTIGAFEDGNLIGFIRVVGDDASIIYIQDLLVKTTYQGLGIGSHLLQAVLEKYKDIRQIVLMTDDTEKTKAFYKKNSMVETSQYEGVAMVKYNL